jgi:hypothetical protein
LAHHVNLQPLLLLAQCMRYSFVRMLVFFNRCMLPFYYTNLAAAFDLAPLPWRYRIGWIDKKKAWS